MLFASLNYLAVVAAAVGSFVFGGIWYSALSKHWVDATGHEPAAFKDSLGLYLITFAAQLVMAWALASVLTHLARWNVRAGQYVEARRLLSEVTNSVYQVLRQRIERSITNKTGRALEPLPPLLSCCSLYSRYVIMQFHNIFLLLTGSKTTMPKNLQGDRTNKTRRFFIRNEYRPLSHWAYS